MIPATTTWICDKCGETVNGIGDGWVQWLTIPKDDSEAGFKCEGLQLVHAFRPNQPRCHYVGDRVFRTKNATTSDGDLRGFVGHDGMMKLLSFVAGEAFEDKAEVVEMIKRIFVPGYERVRRHLDQARSEGIFETNMPEGFPRQPEIEDVLKWLDEDSAQSRG